MAKGILAQGWLIGIKTICKYCGGISERTFYEWRHKHGLPVMQTPSGSIAAIPYLLDKWLIAWNEKLKGSEPACPYLGSFYCHIDADEL